MTNITNCLYLINSIRNDPTISDKLDEDFKSKLDFVHTVLTQNSTADKVIPLFVNLHKELENQSLLTKTKIEKIHQKLTKAEAVLTPVPKSHVEKKKIDLAFYFFCDIDSEDHNGAIAGFLDSALGSDIPFITTKSILTNSKREEFPKSLSIASEFSKWEIYQQVHPDYGEELLVFLPKSLVGQMTEDEVLNTFDLNTNGTLKKASVKEAHSPPKGSPMIEAFFDLFTKNPKKTKMFVVSGHGGVGSPGGMSKQNSEKFFEGITQQNCQGLSYISCHSGGESSLPFLTKNKFPVIVHSIGDFPSRGRLDNPRRYFNELKKLFETPGGDTLPKFHAAMERIRTGNYFDETSLVQFYPPYADDSPGGFRPVGESSK